MSGVNKVILVGHLGKDPDVRHLEGGTTLVNFTLATTETYSKEGRKIEQTEWHNVVVWRGLADVAAKYLQKGKLIYLEGKLRTRSFDDKEGVKRYVTEIVADNFTMLGRKENEHQAPAGTPSQKPNEQFTNTHGSNTDDLPF